MNQKTEFIIAGVLFVLLSVGIVSAYAWTNRDSLDVAEFTKPTQTNAPQSGVIAVLGQTNTQPRQTPSTPASAQEPTASSADTPTPSELGSYTLDLPAGWVLTDSKIEENPCGDGKKWKTDTYVNAQETLTVYENGHPGGCERSIVVDTNLDFNYTADMGGLTIDTSVIKQCAKAENPACPVGDGVVDLLIGNISATDPSGSEINTKNGNTYFFRLVDTKIDQNQFEAQVTGLANLIQAIKF